MLMLWDCDPPPPPRWLELVAYSILAGVLLYALLSGVHKAQYAIWGL